MLKRSFRHTIWDTARKLTWLGKVYWDQDGIWSVGYFVPTVGINEETIRKYIEHQGREDSGEAKLLF